MSEFVKDAAYIADLENDLEAAERQQQEAFQDARRLRKVVAKLVTQCRDGGLIRCMYTSETPGPDCDCVHCRLATMARAALRGEDWKPRPWEKTEETTDER